MVVNLGSTEAEVATRLGGRAVLPRWGFVVEAPRFAAFYATRWGGQPYPGGALFTLQATGRGGLAQASRVRVFHGFGEPTLRWRGKTHEVKRERVLSARR